MSYSSCILCEQMVPAYEKYCRACLRKHPQLQQVEDFWKHYVYTWEAAKQLAQNELAGKERG